MILIFKMVTENPTWGAPRIHGELLKLAFAIIRRERSRAGFCARPRDPQPTKRWQSFSMPNWGGRTFTPQRGMAAILTRSTGKLVAPLLSIVPG